MTDLTEQLARAWTSLCRGEDVSGDLGAARQALGEAAHRAMAARLLLSWSLGAGAWTEAEGLLASPDPAVREMAAKELKALLDLRPGLALGPLLPCLCALLSREGEPAIVGESAARAVARIAATGADVRAALPTLRAAMLRRNKVIRRAVGEVLARQPTDGLAALLGPIADELFVADRVTRDKAARALQSAADSGHAIPAAAATRLDELRLTRDRNATGLPEFLDPIALDPLHAWTARLEQWDRRLADVCYLITCYERGRERRRFFAQLADYVARDASELRRRLQEVARSDQPNTPYTGSAESRVAGLYRDVVTRRAPQS